MTSPVSPSIPKNLSCPAFGQTTAVSFERVNPTVGKTNLLGLETLTTAFEKVSLSSSRGQFEQKVQSIIKSTIRWHLKACFISPHKTEEWNLTMSQLRERLFLLSEEQVLKKDLYIPSEEVRKKFNVFLS